jgi:DNA-binding CsgD family transcriptional regulator
MVRYVKFGAPGGSPAELVGRAAQCARLEGVLATARTGTSAVLAVTGEPGVGKTALLGYAVKAAGGFGVTRASGAEGETDLAYAGLQQLCAPLLGGLDALTPAQRTALETAFGLRAGDGGPPDPLLVGLGVLNLLSEAAAARPLLCVVDDVQWLDQASDRALGVVARRLDADPVALLVAGRELGEATRSSVREELRLTGLAEPDARALLAAVLPAWTDSRLLDRIVAETQGNPLALLELPRDKNPAELAGEFGPLSAGRLSERIERSFRRRLAALPADTRRFVLLAAAEPTGDPALLSRARGALGVPAAAATAAADAGLLFVEARVRFSHPLVRSAAYQAASGAERRDAHRALADATDATAHQDRRAWHRGRAAAGPDEKVATELAESAERARKRGGAAAAAAFLQRADELTVAPADRGKRAFAAAAAWHEAGGHDRAMELLEALLDGPLEEVERGRAEWLRARVILIRTDRRDGARQLFRAARMLEPLNRELARSCYLDVLFAYTRSAPGLDRKEVARAMAALPLPERPDGLDLLLHGIGIFESEGFPHGKDIIGQAIATIATTPVVDADNYRILSTAAGYAQSLWDDAASDVITARAVTLAREAGAMGMLPDALGARGVFCLEAGDISAAAAAFDEELALREATGTEDYGNALGWLAALRDTESVALATLGEIARRHEHVSDDARRGVMSVDQWGRSLLYNGLGRHSEALRAARRGCEAHSTGGFLFLLAELVEAAARCAQFDEARTALAGLHTRLRFADDRDYPLGMTASLSALLEDGAAAEVLYAEGVERLGRTRMRLPLARAHLLYGEWLRRERRRADAREQLRIAHEMFEVMGTRSFAERARAELAATGVTAHSRQQATLDELTPQEARVASLAAEGLSNPEIAARLYISRGTVDYHLNNVFRKLSIRSRAQLTHALTAGG